MKKLYLENRTSLSTNTDIRMINNRSNNNALTADIVPPNADSIIAENNNLLNDDSERLGFLYLRQDRDPACHQTWLPQTTT